MSLRFLLALITSAALSTLTITLKAQTAPATTSSAKPTLWIIGDSTVRNNANGGLGWGAPLAQLFDPAKISINNSAIAGRSARSFYSEGRWTTVKNGLKPGDFILMQFGTNDGPGNETQITNSTNGRPELAGIGEETTTGPNSSSQHAIETVHTYGWYMKLYLADSKAKGATPIMLTMVPQNRWTPDGKISRQNVTNTFVKWSIEVAKLENTNFINLNGVAAKRLEKDGRDVVGPKYFTPPGDGTHTNPAGAMLNAESVIMGIRALKDLALNNYLSEAGKKLELADAEDVMAPSPPVTSPATAASK